MLQNTGYLIEIIIEIYFADCTVHFRFSNLYLQQPSYWCWNVTTEDSH